MHPAPAQRIQNDRRRGGQRLALAGAHLGDRPVVQHHAADQLDVEVTHPHAALAGLAHEREALEHQIVEALAVCRPLAQLVGGLPQLRVGVVLELRLVAVDPSDALFIGLELLAFAHAKSAVQNGHVASVAVGFEPFRPLSGGRADPGLRPRIIGHAGLLHRLHRRLGGRVLGGRGPLLAPLTSLVPMALDLDLRAHQRTG